MHNMKTEQLEIINQKIKELIGIYREAVTNSGISENEYWIWYTLIIMEGEYTQQDICESWSLSKQTVNTIITHLVREEFVVLEVVPGTRNKKIIRLTEKGRLYGKDLVTPIANAEKKAIDRLPLKDRVACMKILSKYIEILKEEMKNEAVK